MEHLVRLTHQDMPISLILFIAVRGTVPTVEIIHIIFTTMFTQKIMYIVMAHNLDWLILTLD